MPRQSLKEHMAEAIKDAQRLGPLQPVGTCGPGRGRTVAERKQAGNVNVYLCRRLMRDHPYIWRKLREGKYRSVRAAAIDAGIITPRTAAPLSGSSEIEP